MDMENTNEINKKIANNLIRHRKAAGMTQAELAEKINYSDKSVSKWESGNGVPDVYTLIQIANLFGVTLNDLVGDEASQPVLPTKKSHGLHVLIMLFRFHVGMDGADVYLFNGAIDLHSIRQQLRRGVDGVLIRRALAGVGNFMDVLPFIVYEE